MYSVVRSEISPVVSTVDQSKDSYRNANWCMHALSIEFDLLYVRRRYHRLTATLLLCRRVLGMTVELPRDVPSTRFRFLTNPDIA